LKETIMAEMLLINPRKRAKRTARKTTAKRRRNPIAAVARHAPKRRRNPIGLARVARRRRNPISISRSGIMREVQEALIGGAGALAVDVLMGQINGYIPASMQRVAGKVGIGDAVKMAITIALGQALNKPTKGMSRKFATGALICQSRDILASLVPSTMTLGFASPARIVRGTQRVGPLMAYAPQSGAVDSSPLLGAYSPAGRNRGVLLNGARNREGVTTYS
jgi:hypothetical protein